MTLYQIETRLEEMTIGRTTTINDRVVTRLAQLAWEVGTFGRKSQDIEEAAIEIKS